MPNIFKKLIGGGGGGIVKEYASAALNQRYAMKRQHDAQDFSAQQYASRYQTTTADMKAAGLNPMLAYQQGAGSAPSGSPAGGGGQADFSAAENETRVASAQEAQIREQTENTKSDTAVKAEEAKNLEVTRQKTIQETENLRQSAEQIKITIEQIRAQIQKNVVEIDKLRTEIATGKATQKQIAAYTALLKEQEYLATTQAALNNQQYAINTPKEKAAGMPTGLGGAIGENVWKVIKGK